MDFVVINDPSLSEESDVANMVPKLNKTIRKLCDELLSDFTDFANEEEDGSRAIMFMFFALSGIVRIGINFLATGIDTPISILEQNFLKSIVATLSQHHPQEIH